MHRRLSLAVRAALLAFAVSGPSCLPPPPGFPSPDPDRDGDGWPESEDCWDAQQSWDCNNADPENVHPGADEICNDIDDDCDGEVDEDPVDAQVTGYEDLDGDGHGDPALAIVGCDDGALLDWADAPNPPGDDCDDSDPGVYPGRWEDCDNGLDDDCNQLVDADDPACPPPADDDDDDDSALDDDDSAR